MCYCFYMKSMSQNPHASHEVVNAKERWKVVGSFHYLFMYLICSDRSFDFDPSHYFNFLSVVGARSFDVTSSRYCSRPSNNTKRGWVPFSTKPQVVTPT